MSRTIIYIWNAALTIALIGLIIFVAGKGKNNNKGNVLAGDGNGPVIAYVNTDTLLEHYNYFKANRDRLDAKQKQMEQELTNAGTALQAEYEGIQRRLNAMSASEAKQAEATLQSKQESLMQRRDALGEQMNEEMKKMDDELYKKIQAYLAEYNKEHKYAYILGFTRTGGILLADPKLDITKEILDGMNKAYDKEK
jgi:outer membrane protein